MRILVALPWLAGPHPSTLGSLRGGSLRVGPHDRVVGQGRQPAFAWALGRSPGAPYHGPALLGTFGISSRIVNGLAAL